MIKFAMIAGLAVSAGASAASGQSAARPGPKPIAPLEWLVGGTWTADASTMAAGLSIETRYTWADNDAYVRFTTHFVTNGSAFKNYDGNFFWSPEQSSLRMWYMDAKNGITQGPVMANGNAMVMTFHGPDFDGKPADLRVTVTRKTNDLYTWMVEEDQPGAGWKQLASLDYRRAPGT